MMRLDDLDQRIIGLLAEDARISNREAARLLGISDTAVRKRLKKLSDSGAAKITAVADSAALGMTTAVLVRVQTSPETARDVVEAMARFDEVSFAALMTGRFNIVLLVAAQSRQAVADIIHMHLRRRSGVHRVETVEIVSVAKHNLEIALVSRKR